MVGRISNWNFSYRRKNLHDGSGQFTCFTKRPVLHSGITPESLQKDILHLQKVLIERGFTVQQTGRFDEATENAVKEFQKITGLRVDGVVGPLTWAALLFPRLSRKQHSREGTADTEAIKHLQNILDQEGFGTDCNGIFTVHTEQALKRFQSLNGLVPSGNCGPRTWSVLLGQRQELTPDDYLRMRRTFIIEQLMMMIAVQVGIYTNPLNLEHELSIQSNLVVAYVVAYFGPALLEKLPKEGSTFQSHPIWRYAPYVFMGFVWRHVLEVFNVG